MKSSTWRCELPFDSAAVWEVMRDLTQYAWRSDIKRIETVDALTFREIYPNGNETMFTITEKKQNSLYAFHMENKRFSGDWSGRLQSLADGGCLLVLEEKIEIHHPVMRLVAGIAWDLKKLQKLYIDDLTKELHRRYDCK